MFAPKAAEFTIHKNQVYKTLAASGMCLVCAVTFFAGSKKV